MSTWTENSGNQPDDSEALEFEELLFDAAAVFDTLEEREKFLKYACPDPEMQGRVQALFGKQNGAEDFFEFETQVNLGSALPVSVEEEGLGVEVGRYRLIERIGAGGFGVVYLAEQREPVRRKVALKIIRMGLESPESTTRFKAERQALASMNHPSIARILDGGTTPSGRAYFVMELVDGEPITSYCDARRVNVRDRARLFVEVCRAIQHAHQKAVVHCDIKPSNILVETHEAKPMPKVIDFGIAKDRGPQVEEAAALDSSQGGVIGTPAYISPEQASGDEPVDTRSDVYSLGILLCEMLCGSPGHRHEGLMESGETEIRRVLATTRTELPSTLLKELPPEGRDTVAQCRGVRIEQLLEWCRKDLDWVVKKAVARNPSARYETANALAADVCRWLDNEPVVARPQTRNYRLAKLIKRNRLWFGAGTLAFVGLVSGLSVATVLFLKEKNARAAQERLRIQAEKAHFAETELRKLWEFRSLLAESAVRLRYRDLAGAAVLVASVPVESAPASLEAVAVYDQLGEWHRAEGRMGEAEKCYFAMVYSLASVDRADTDANSDRFLPASAILAASKDGENYEKFRRLALDHFENTENPIVAERVLKSCSLKPGPEEIVIRTRKLATVIGVESQAADSPERDFGAWSSLSLSLYSYRSGLDDQARIWAMRCLSKGDENPTCSISAKIVLALISQRERNPVEAASFLESAVKDTGNRLEIGPDNGSAQVGFWFDWMNVRTLLTEAGWQSSEH